MFGGPFSKEQMKNYALLYGSIVVIMVLFFIAAKLFYVADTQEKRVFETKVLDRKEILKKVDIPKANRPFKLMEKAY